MLDGPACLHRSNGTAMNPAPGSALHCRNAVLCGAIGPWAHRRRDVGWAALPKRLMTCDTHAAHAFRRHVKLRSSANAAWTRERRTRRRRASCRVEPSTLQKNDAAPNLRADAQGNSSNNRSCGSALAWLAIRLGTPTPRSPADAVKMTVLASQCPCLTEHDRHDHRFIRHQRRRREEQPSGKCHTHDAAACSPMRMESNPIKLR